MSAVYPVEEEYVRVYYRNNKYDVPVSFATKMHPGGNEILMRYKDADITRAFEKTEHSRDAFRMLQRWAVDPSAVEQTYATEAAEEAEKKSQKPSTLWNRLVIVLGLASVVAAVELRSQ